VNANSIVPDVVVIGYGNDLRGDDGIGPHLAAAVVARAGPRVRALAVHQLTPELAEVVARARMAVFVDARVPAAGELVQVRRVPESRGGPLSHSGDPGVLLALARDLYGRAPKAWWVTVAGESFGLGEALSPEARARCRVALERILSLVGSESDCANLETAVRDRTERRGGTGSPEVP
jgi:hydrogenase maturation protease